MAANDEEKLQSMVAELRVLEAYFNELTGRESLVARAMVETRAASESVKSLSAQGVTEVLFPIGGGVLVQANTPPPDRIIVSVGSNVAVEKSRDDSLAFLDARLQELEKAAVSLQREKAGLAGRINSVRAAINRLLEQQQG